MKVLMVTPFPPLRDGVGKYALQEVVSLREEGHEVDVCAPVACAAHHVEDFKRGRGLFKLRKYSRHYDRVVVQYQPSHYLLRGQGFSYLRLALWLGLAFRRMRNLSVVCHEIDYPPKTWSRFRPERIAQRWAWRGARRVEFHTAAEVEKMEAEIGCRPREVVLRDHGAYFRAAVDETREVAREKLGLREHATVFLCIGFIAEHKGFDRAARAFARVPGDHARLVIAGSMSVSTPEHEAYMAWLRDVVAIDRRIRLIEGALSDAEFDRWIVASDAVVVPYRKIWSSSVIERAKLLGRRVIATRAGGLADQLSAEDELVDDDDGLAEALSRAVGAGSPRAGGALSPGDAFSFVRRQALMRHTGGELRVDQVGGVLAAMDASKHVQPVLVPPGWRPMAALVRFARPPVRWIVDRFVQPTLQQINSFQDTTTSALRAVVDELRGSDHDPSMEGYRAFLDQSDNASSYEVLEALRGADAVLVLGATSRILGALSEVECTAKGTESDPVLVDNLRAAGHMVEEAGPFVALSRVRHRTQDAVVLNRVIERLPPREILRLLVRVERVLRPGGLAICFMTNARSPQALALQHFRDVTNVQPVHADVLTFLASRSGFVDVETLPDVSVSDVGLPATYALIAKAP